MKREFRNLDTLINPIICDKEFNNNFFLFRDNVTLLNTRINKIQSFHYDYTS